jgi:hypothetical protein
MKCYELALDGYRFADQSVMDDYGRVFFYNGRVFRAIWGSANAEFFRDVLAEPWIEHLYATGLIKTWIPNDLKVKDIPLILEHELINFQTHPVENTDYMHWKMALQVVDILIVLDRNKLALKDGHSWNSMILRGSPVFIDIGSIAVKTIHLNKAWMSEFYRYYIVPIWIARTRWHRYSREYRREHEQGFGINIFSNARIRKLLWGEFDKKIASGVEFSHVLASIRAWLVKHEPRNVHFGEWVDYSARSVVAEDLAIDKEKDNIVLAALKEANPKTVLDIAANTGRYAELAADLGSAVVAFDYEEGCVNECYERAERRQLNITPVQMDFLAPTPSYAMALVGKDAFTRFRSELVLALASIHHICLRQGLPVSLYLDTCIQFSSRFVFIEYVDPDDIHLKQWERPIPAQYSLDYIINYMLFQGYLVKSKYAIEFRGIKRNFLLFDNRPNL